MLAWSTYEYLGNLALILFQLLNKKYPFELFQKTSCYYPLIPMLPGLNDVPIHP